MRLLFRQNQMLSSVNWWGQIQRKTWCLGPYAGVDYNLTLCPLQSRLQHIYHGIGQLMPESTLTLCQSRLYPPSQGHCILPLAIETLFSISILTNGIRVLKVAACVLCMEAAFNKYCTSTSARLLRSYSIWLRLHIKVLSFTPTAEIMMNKCTNCLKSTLVLL